MDFTVIPECYIDTNLVETLVPPKNGGSYNHQKGCGTVSVRMNERRLADGFALGIMDKDKREVSYVREFNEICNTGSLFLSKHRTRHHYIIQISPAVEQFILESAAAAGLSLSKYGLPTDLHQLRKEAKQVNSKEDPSFKRLFWALGQRNVYQIECFKKWIQYLTDKRYNVDLNVLRTLHTLEE